MRQTIRRGRADRQQLDPLGHDKIIVYTDIKTAEIHHIDTTNTLGLEL